MPPEGGDLFIVGGDDDAYVGVRDDNDVDDLVSQVFFDLLPTEYVYEDSDSTCNAPHTERSKFHEPRHHWLGNIQATRPKL